MLDYMRRNAQSIVIVFILSILILAFVIEFGPQSQGCRGDQGPRGRTAQTVLTVLGYAVANTELDLWRLHVGSEPGGDFGGTYVPCYRMGLLSALGSEGGGLGEAADPREFDLVHFRNAFLIREALVRQADRFGLVADDEEVKSALARGRIFIFDHGYWVDPVTRSVRFCGGELPLRVGIGREGKFDPTALRSRLQTSYHMSVDDFLAFQRRNLLALKMQQILAAGIALTRPEIETELRAEAEEVTLTVWTVTPAADTDEQIAALQTRFDQARDSISDDDVDAWLALSSNARRTDDRLASIGSAATPQPTPPPPAPPESRRREIARSLMAVDQMADQVRAAARMARIALARPDAPPETPPPAPEGVAIHAQSVTIRPLAPAAVPPHALRGLDDAVTRVTALTEAAPVLTDDIERDATMTSVKAPSGESFGLREVALVRRLPPWSQEKAVAAAVREWLPVRTAAALDLKRAHVLEAWYESRLFAARASDQLDDEVLMRSLAPQEEPQPE